MALGESGIDEVRCEGEDDVVLVLANPPGFVEYIQVKASRPDQLWTKALLESRTNVQQSLLEHSLTRDRYSETPLFRVVTLREVNSDLRVLTEDRGQRSSEDCERLFRQLSAHSRGLTSDSGRSTRYWIDHALWEVRGDEQNVRQKNIDKVDRLAEQHNQLLTRTQKQIVYDALLKIVFDAACSSEPAAKRIAQRCAGDALVSAMIDAVHGKDTSIETDLIRKMRDAGIGATLVAAAIDLRRQYRSALAAGGYRSDPSIMQVTGDVQSVLSGLLAELEAGKCHLTGSEFHLLCIRRVDGVRRDYPPGAVPRLVPRGAMYELTNRCSHRFDKDDHAASA